MDRETKTLLAGYLMRRASELHETIERVPVFGKRYHAAVDELEEVEELSDLIAK